MGLLNAGSGGWCLHWSATDSRAVHRQVVDERHGRCTLWRVSIHGVAEVGIWSAEGEPCRQFCSAVGRDFMSHRMWCRADDGVSR